MVPTGDVAAATRAVRVVASSTGGKVVNPKRTSYGALEVDAFFGSRQDFDVFVAAVEPLGRIEFLKDLGEAPAYLPKAEAVKQAVSLFNAERYWEAHEVLESLWRVAEGDEKRMLQGLILVCAALVHLQKDEHEVAVGVARRSLPLLSWSGEYHGVAVGSLRERVEKMVGSGELSFFRL
jgi:Lon protease-like protein